MQFPIRTGPRAILSALLLVIFGNAFSNFGGPKMEAEAMRLLQRNCLNCHNAEKQKGGLDLSSRYSALKGGDEGPVLAPKKPDQSKLISALAAEADPHMPPKKQLKPAEIDLLRRWVSGGAKWDAEALALASRPRDVKIGAVPGNLTAVYTVALTTNGSHLAIGRGAKIEIVELAATNKTEFPAHSEFVRAMAWSADGKRLASGSFREVAVWEDGKAIWKNQFKEGERVNAIRFGPDGSDLIVGRGPEVMILDAATGKEKTKWVAHADAINDLAVSADGKLLATAGADKLAKIWEIAGAKEVARLEGHSAPVYGLAFNTNATELLTVGGDQQLFVWDVKTRESFVTLNDRKSALTSVAWPAEGKAAIAVDEEGGTWTFTDFKRHTGAQSSEAARDRKINSGPELALHAIAASADGKKIAVAGEDGTVRILDETGKEKLKLSAEQKNSQIAQGPSPSFIRDVLPALAKAGCMGGSCHAKPEGQNGFKLSVFSYDPLSDYHEITREARGRRVFPAAPEESLLLLKPTATVEHGGGERFAVGSETYQLLARWIRAGMPYQNTNEPALVKISVNPAERVYKKSSSLGLQVMAHYSDGSTQSVTRLAEFAANDKEIAQVNEAGVIRAGNLSGETVVVARYMGMVAPSRVTIPTDRKLQESKYATLPMNNFIDELAYRRFKNLGLFPSALCTDEEFLRRTMLDAIGRLPTVDEARAFMADEAPMKRQRWIERILADSAYADYWANKWADLLRPNPDRVGVKSIFVLDQWLRESFRANKPYDKFAREILTVEGSNHAEGPAVIYRDKREPQDRTTMFSQIFLGTRMECAKCHHHPNEKWSQDDFYQFAAFFGPLKQKGAGLSPPISAGNESFYFTSGAGSVKHPVTGKQMSPRPPDAADFKVDEKHDPRAELADWLVNPKNPFFARAAVNRVWAVFFGRGFVEPVDDFRASNPIINEPLLNALADDFAGKGYDFKVLMRTIMNSHLYQLSSRPNEYNLTDTKNFSRSYRRRLPAEVLLDAVNDVLGATDEFNGAPPGSRAMQTWSYKVSSQFMDAFSRPNASSDAPCEREGKTSIMQSLHMMNSRQLQEKLSKESGRVRQWAESKLSPLEIVTELYLAAYCRKPTTVELASALTAFEVGSKRQTATEDVLWALLNSPEFVFNH